LTGYNNLTGKQMWY